MKRIEIIIPNRELKEVHVKNISRMRKNRLIKPDMNLMQEKSESFKLNIYCLWLDNYRIWEWILVLPWDLGVDTTLFHNQDDK